MNQLEPVVEAHEPQPIEDHNTLQGSDTFHPPSIPQDESAVLETLNAEVKDQDAIERDIGRQADRLLNEQANSREQQRLERTKEQRRKLVSTINRHAEEISRPIGATKRAKLKADIERIRLQIASLDHDIKDIEARIETHDAVSSKAGDEAPVSGRLPHESQRDFLIRTGKITPFSRYGLTSHGEAPDTLQGALFDAEDETEAEPSLPDGQAASMSHRHLRRPGFEEDDLSTADERDSNVARKRRRIEKDSPGRKKRIWSSSEFEASDTASQDEQTEADGEESSEDEGDKDDDDMPVTQGKRRRQRRARAALQDKDNVEDLRGVDDGNAAVYYTRLRRWARRRRHARQKVRMKIVNLDEDQSEQQVDGDDGSVDIEEAYLPHPTVPDTEFDDGFKMPGDIYPSLFDYQKTGVQWLHELYTQQVGGIIGDEMGLGKTIQAISFLAGLHHSRKLNKPAIVVCPATVMKQWVNEFHDWWPPLRVTILHSSGSGMINIQSESNREDKMLEETWNPNARNMPLTAAQKSARKILQPILDSGGVLVTTYSGLQSYAPLLIPVDWSYAILDEGHKIRNPNTAITIYCKELRTPNRIILSGTPMQNNLIELWSLFDFVFPMRLGTLVNFRNQFDIPVRQGGYANASNLQVQTAYKCAETLKDAISPYLLQRFKVDVASDLPKKSEQVLFCKLTKLQREAYAKFLASDELNAIISGKRQVLYGVDILRKICNHPDLVNHKGLSGKVEYNYGDPANSGKMQVVGPLLELWQKTGHKTLLFAQHRIMLDILEKFVRSITGMRYRRMDGNTPIQQRQAMVDEFNNNPDLHVFLLTTKVGGLGINLTGADRVLIYDPDWNPSTDLQARERAWRLGQKREVSIYRLMTAGTIEEKIYHRQIFKQFLTNKILKDPKQRQTFHLSDLHDLFTLGKEGDPTETSTLFSNAKVELKSTISMDRSGEVRDSCSKTDTTAAGEPSIKNLPGFSSLERYAGEIEEEKQVNTNGAVNSEARMMQGIFSKSGIHSAMEHDAIISGQTAAKPGADPYLIEREAKKVAAEAARELERAGEIARAVPVGTPTWTGQFGVSGRPKETNAYQAFSSARARNGFAPGSSALLAGLQQRQGLNGTGVPSPGRLSSPALSITSTFSRGGSPAAPSGKDFGKLIRDYLVSHGGSVYTQMLIDHFNRFCTSAQATADFKETLKTIARLEKGGRGRGRWVLKDQFKT